MIPAYVFVIAYFVLTALLWAGNRSVGIKRPLASSAKWFVWTATWISFSVMILDLTPDKMNLDNLIGPLAISIFIYPMLILTPQPGTSGGMLAVMWAGPWIAAAVGYVLAVRHNVHRETNPVVKRTKTRAVR